MSRRKVKEAVEAEPELSAEEEVEDEQTEADVEESDLELSEHSEASERPPVSSPNSKKTGSKKPVKLRKDGQVDRRRETALKNLEKARAARAQKAKEAREARAAAAAAGEAVEEKKTKKKKTTSHVVETVIEDGSDESETEFALVPVSKAKGGKSSKTAKVTSAATTPDQMQALMQMMMQTMLQGQAPPAQKKKRPTKIVTKVQVPASKPEFSEHVAPSPAKKEPAKVDPAEHLRKMMFG